MLGCSKNDEWDRVEEYRYTSRLKLLRKGTKPRNTVKPMVKRTKCQVSEVILMLIFGLAVEGLASFFL